MVATAARKTTRTAPVQAPAAATQTEAPASVLTLNGTTRGKLVLFAIPRSELVDDGPVMRGFVETPEGKIDAAGWKKTARDTGVEYLSLKLGNTRKPAEDAPAGEPVEYVVGPFYGRLFRETKTDRDSGRTVVKRYWGYIEKADKIGTDPRGQAVYKNVWELAVQAKPAISGDNRTHYINGMVSPKAHDQDEQDSGLPF